MYTELLFDSENGSSLLIDSKLKVLTVRGWKNARLMLGSQ